MTTRSSRHLGRAAIAAVWLVAAYLSLYYAALLALGPDRLYSLLGEANYNRLIPVGGFSFLLFVVLWSLLWAVPTAALAILLGLAVRATRLSIPQTSRRVLAIGVALAVVVTLHMRSLDGLDGWFWSLAFEEDTFYAAGYSDDAFRQVRAGMTVEEVHALLGPPLGRWDRSNLAVHLRREGERYDGSAFSERWSRSPTSTHFRNRVVHFVDNRVAWKRAKFYVD